RSAILVWGLWAVALLAVCGVAAAAPHRHSVYPIFAAAAQRWLAGANLYQYQGEPYRYSPPVTALLVPPSALPDWLGAVLGRLLTAGGYLGGLAWWTDAVLPRPLPRGRRVLLLLLVLPLSLGNVYNGQSNLLLLGLLLAGVAALATAEAKGRRGGWWWLAAGCVALACLLKVYPVAVGLLLAVVSPLQFAARLALVLAAGLALPFLLQQPDYVLEQYAGWWQHMTADDRTVLPRELWYHDLRLLGAVC